MIAHKDTIVIYKHLSQLNVQKELMEHQLILLQLINAQAAQVDITAHRRDKPHIL